MACGVFPDKGRNRLGLVWGRRKLVTNGVRFAGAGFGSGAVSRWVEEEDGSRR